MKIAFPTKEAQSIRWIVRKKMGVDDCCHPEHRIVGGVKYIKRLYKKYDAAKNPADCSLRLSAIMLLEGSSWMPS